MSFYFLDSTARSAWLAATTKTGQLEGLRDVWAGQLDLKHYRADGVLLATVRHATPVVRTDTWELVPGAYVSQTVWASGVPTYCVWAVPGGADIVRADSTWDAADPTISDPGGRVRVDIGSQMGLHATASLPATDIPAWRTAMTNTDTLYYVTASAPTSAPALTVPTRFSPDRQLAYGSGTLLQDVGGQYGTMVYGTGGHAVIANQLLGLDLNDNAPTWSWWHNPNYQTSDTNSANLYYAPSEEATLVAGARGTAARIRPGFENTDAPLWDRQFPVAFDGWIFPRELTTGQMGNNVPHGFRYSCTAYVPASVTGTDPMFFTITGAQGPFDQNAKPATVSDAEWFDASVLVSSTRSKFPYYFRNCTTGDWTMHQWQPNGMTLASAYSAPPIGVFTDLKRIYVCGGNSNGAGYYYIDLSAGFGSQTVSSFITTQSGGGSHVDGSRYSCGAFSEGDPLGRHFMVTNANDANTTKLAVYDFDANTSFLIDLNSYGFVFDGQDERMGFSYDPTNQRVLILMAPRPNENTPYYWSITVPSTLTNSAGWVASKRFLSFSDSAMATTIFAPDQNNQNGLAGFYGKTRLHPTLGCILVPSCDYRMTAFVPSV